MYETGLGDSLSRRNLWARSQQIEAQLAEELDADKLDRFTDWLLDRVVLVGIRGANQDHGYRMFETMNDRGTRLTAVDLLKSHLLANVGTGVRGGGEGLLARRERAVRRAFEVALEGFAAQILLR
ncbi:DUF262 domain-containing protein [Streptomyces sp. NEAU-YJ-81]|uniref:DUF262 domain-containing protein n=1 Tax=Streptomyces sp. NEAU-YJ-81 TaxID=2820288 RepID=UPI001ABC2108|nr:DUF262 domain-containing protein [Streptomyces sp. NEAU-YJ-81]MBO3682647.1 DUF262 domain-containing protein [Streptomyces sp. NEAU-YJ-81]